MLFDSVIDESKKTIVRFIDNGRVHLKDATWLLVRDVRGRVRVAVDDTDVQPRLVREEQAELARLLGQDLQGWFHGPVVAAQQGNEASGLVKRLSQDAQDEPPDASGVEFKLLERLQSKQAWLPMSGAAPEPPWALDARSPVLVAFFSFKGGVGRTTTLGLFAEYLARRDKKVLCVDLDLEAPGLGEFMGVRGVKSGVLDALLTHAVTGKLPEMTGWWLDAVRPSTDDGGVPRGEIKVLPAGMLGSHYIEKLGRLDFQSASDVAAQSPVELALRALFESAKEEHTPDYILIDSRAGLNEVGGVLLNHLSHVQFLVARNTNQNVEGMKATLTGLAQFKPLAGRARLVQTFVDDKEEELQRQAFRDELWDSFYAGDDGTRVATAVLGPHTPLVMLNSAEFARSGKLSELWGRLPRTFETMNLKPLEDALGALVTEKVQA